MVGQNVGMQLVTPDQTYNLEVFGSTSVAQKAVYPIRKTGTFVANGSSVVNVAFPAMTVGTLILISLNTVGGTVGALPALQTVTAGTGFGVAGTAGDTSTYNWAAIAP